MSPCIQISTMPDNLGETLEIGVCSKQWSGVMEAFVDVDFFNIRCKFTVLKLFINNLTIAMLLVLIRVIHNIVIVVRV